MNLNIPEIMTRKEVAALLHISKGTLLNHVHNGKIEAFRIGNTFRFTREAVTEFIQNSVYSSCC